MLPFPDGSLLLLGCTCSSWVSPFEVGECKHGRFGVLDRQRDCCFESCVETETPGRFIFFNEENGDFLHLQ